MPSLDVCGSQQPRIRRESTSLPRYPLFLLTGRTAAVVASLFGPGVGAPGSDQPTGLHIKT